MSKLQNSENQKFEKGGIKMNSSNIEYTNFYSKALRIAGVVLQFSPLLGIILRNKPILPWIAVLLVLGGLAALFICFVLAETIQILYDIRNNTSKNIETNICNEVADSQDLQTTNI